MKPPLFMELTLGTEAINPPPPRLPALLTNQ